MLSLATRGIIYSKIYDSDSTTSLRRHYPHQVLWVSSQLRHVASAPRVSFFDAAKVIIYFHSCKKKSVFVCEHKNNEPSTSCEGNGSFRLSHDNLTFIADIEAFLQSMAIDTAATEIIDMIVLRR